MRERGLSEKEIENEISEMNTFYQKTLYQEYKRSQDEINKKVSTQTATQSIVCSDVSASEKAVLQAIYDNLNGVAWATNWDFNTPVTSWDSATQTGWYGITLNESCGIEKISLINVNVQGIFPDLSNLSSLKFLQIQPNRAGYSPVPYFIGGDFSSIATLQNIESIFLEDCDFGGNFPSNFINIASTIRVLSLRRCNLNDMNELCSIVSMYSLLETLHLDENNFSGVLPSCFNPNNFSDLTQITMSWNDITNIDVLESFYNLYTVDFRFNQISGDIPDFSNNVNLTYLSLRSNSITGVIPINYPGNIYVLDLSRNYLEGDIPMLNINSSWQTHSFIIENNKFKFKNLENNFSYYQNYFSTLSYNPQAKTDAVIDDTIGSGSSYTMTMHEDGNYSSVEEYQWYKGTYPNGVAISGATSRQYTIGSVSTSDTGSYYCLSTHPDITISSNNNKNLVLQRESINLVVAACEPLEGTIKFLKGTNLYCKDEKISVSFSSSSTLGTNFEYLWTFNDSGNLITSNDVDFAFIPTSSVGISSTITLQLTDIDTGCIYNYTSEEINIINCAACDFGRGNFGIIASKFVSLLNYLTTLTNVPDGFTCPELVDLTPFIMVSNPTINNFTNSSGVMTFSFSSSTTDDVEYYYDNNSVLSSISLIDYHGYNDSSFFLNQYQGDDFYYNRGSNVKNIDFCNEDPCTLHNPYSQTIKQYYISLINRLLTDALANGNTLPNGYYPYPELSNLAPYITDSNIGIYNAHFTISYDNNDYREDFRFSFTDHAVEDYDVSVRYLGYLLDDIDISMYFDDPNTLNFIDMTYKNGYVEAKQLVKHIDFCPDELIPCTTTNPYSPVVRGLFLDLLEHLIQRKLNGDTDSAIEGSTPVELIALAPYITDPNPVGIYNFVSTYASNGLIGISFSFISGHSADVYIEGTNLYNLNSNNFQFDLSNYSDSEQGITIINYSSEEFTLKVGKIKHIEFCPDELLCKAHVAIVVDESGSIDDREAFRIRTQLSSFIEKQASDNETLGANMHISLIGLSDSDDPTSRDSGISSSGNNVIGTEKITSQNKNQYLDWIKDYRRGRVSPSSDYWRGGLEKALSLGDVDLVILITDGCQTNDAGLLKETVRKFNNNGGGTDNENTTIPPHLFVIGVEDGFYVDTDESPIKGKVLSTNQDPNYNTELSRQSTTGRVASFLRTSLKYLMEYTDQGSFPVEEKYYFQYNNESPALMVDYYGTDDFGFFTDEVNYLSNGLTGSDVDLSCGGYIPLETCNNCINFKLDEGREYVVSTWVKEEQKTQVYNYDNSKIYINFSDDAGKRILHPSDPANTIDPGDPQYSPWPYYVKGETSGEIIDGWQRIFTKFTVPSNAIYLEVELVNLSQIVPVYFDDIRIHPKNGSMKSFVYDPETFRLMSELDENNYSTFYEYDKEGGLIRVKKETSRGVKTIQETRSGNVIKEDNDE
ncbi:hypothetical protein [Flavobacterium sp. U410]